jgi:hypothetical protein
MFRKGRGNVAGIYHQGLAKINPSRVLPTALAREPGTMLKAVLDNELVDISLTGSV